MLAEIVGEFLKADWGRSRLITGGVIGGHYCNSLMMFLGWVAHRGPQSRLCISSQIELARFESAGASALHVHTLAFGLNPGDATGTQGIGVWSAEVCWLHRHSLNLFVGQQVLNLLPSPGIPTLWQRLTVKNLNNRAVILGWFFLGLSNCRSNWVYFVYWNNPHTCEFRLILIDRYVFHARVSWLL